MREKLDGSLGTTATSTMDMDGRGTQPGRRSGNAWQRLHQRVRRRRPMNCRRRVVATSARRLSRATTTPLLQFSLLKTRLLFSATNETFALLNNSCQLRAHTPSVSLARMMLSVGVIFILRKRSAMPMFGRGPGLVGPNSSGQQYL